MALPSAEERAQIVNRLQASWKATLKLKCKLHYCLSTSRISCKVTLSTVKITTASWPDPYGLNQRRNAGF
jgi:hypothetical protein